jgi:hypothetical protein
MFDNVACAHLSLTLPGWLLRLCLMRSMCAYAQWLICCALVHEALSSDSHCSLLLIVVVAFAQRNMKMPCACALGLVVDIYPHHCHSCCHPRHRAMLTFVLVIAIVVVVVAVAQRSVKMSGAHARGFVDDFVVFVAPVLVVVAAVRVTYCHALAHKALSLSPSCDATCCRALAHKTLLPLPPCNVTCCCALVHEASLALSLRDAMCQQLVRLCTLLLQYEARAHAHKGLLVDNI